VILNTLASCKSTKSHPSLIPTPEADSIAPAHGMPELEPDMLKLDDTPRVSFADEEEVRIITPRVSSFNSSVTEENSSSPADSGTSTPTSEYSITTSPVARTLADRLSFWSRLSKRTSPTLGGIMPSSLASLSTAEEQRSLDEVKSEENGEPGASLEEILAQTAPPPALEKDRRSELEDKVVRECVREFTKGGMYFAYNFGRFVGHSEVSSVSYPPQTSHGHFNINKNKLQSHKSRMLCYMT
jgi:hypothetical protein